jgi:epoxyqueuosine reductase
MPEVDTPLDAARLAAIRAEIKRYGVALGFQRIGVADIALENDEHHLRRWLARRFHGEMAYMSRHGSKRGHPEQLVRGTIRVVSARMNHLAADGRNADEVLSNRELAYVARYALGRDYHKVVRTRLRKLAAMMGEIAGSCGCRVFSDSAPVLERALARNAGLGWIGKHSNLIDRDHGSWFFIGEIYTDLPLPVDRPYDDEYCGTCTRCLEVCPTRAIVAPYSVDARRCISYLTIELKGSIPPEYRPFIGNRIFGCDDCQLVCPWNRYARLSAEPDFRVRHGLDASSLLRLFAWTEADFRRYTEGSAIRRISYAQWLRNVAVALGNAPGSSELMAALSRRLEYPCEFVREHVRWALERHSSAGGRVDSA